MKTYGYGYHCCISRGSGSDSLSETLKKAIDEGYSFIVEYNDEPGKENQRKLMYWKGKILHYTKALDHFADNRNQQRLLHSYYQNGNTMFMIAPAPNDEVNVFPIREFEETEDISDKLEELLK